MQWHLPLNIMINTVLFRSGVWNSQLYACLLLLLVLLSSNKIAKSAWKTVKTGAIGTEMNTYFRKLGCNPLHHSRGKYSSHMQSSMVCH